MTIAYITTHGDPSVGIYGCFTEVDLNIDLDDENREEYRKMLADFFSELWGEKAKVQFAELMPNAVLSGGPTRRVRLEPLVMPGAPNEGRNQEQDH